MWILLFVIIFIAIVIVFFKIPYSMLKRNFQNDIKYYLNQFGLKKELIEEKDILRLPEPVQNYFKVSGYLGKNKMTIMKAYIKSAPLIDSKDKPPMIVDYTLCSFADKPVRLAYIKTFMFGIPFEAYDSTQNGIGFMKGIIGKVFTLFNQTGDEMDKAQLLTYLGECFLNPSSILSEYIIWETIDNTHVKATIDYKGISGSGIFTFDDIGFVQSFQTNERAKIDTDGSVKYPKWSLIYNSFTEKNGIFYPTNIKTIWHDNDGDLVYFDANSIKIEFDS